MNLKKLLSREIIITIISVILISITFFSVSYAIYMTVDERAMGTLSFADIDFEICVDSTCENVGENLGNSTINVSLVPMSDSEGVALTPYSFKITNSGLLDLKAYVYMGAYDGSSTSFDFSKLRVATKLSTDSEYSINDFGEGEISSAYLITLEPGDSKIINVLIWAGEEIGNDIMGKNFTAYVNAVAYYQPEDEDELHTIVPYGTNTVPGAQFITQFSHTGNYQTFTPVVSGWYNVELWGAKGGNIATGYGGYTKGYIYMTENTNYYLYVGGLPTAGCLVGTGGGYNGGGNPGTVGCSRAAGGATDIRLVSGLWNDTAGLRSRIMVAGGGGSGENDLGGVGGNLMGGANNAGTSATQTTGSAFGYATTPTIDSSGAGGGYWGGVLATADGVAAGGGSSYISGYAGANSVTSASSTTPTNNTLHYSSKYFINGKMLSGVNSVDGKAKITYVGINKPGRKNTKLNNVRYIRDCVNGNSSNTANQWSEIQGIYNGQNVALNKTVTGTSAVNTGTNSGTYTTITNGVVSGLTTDLAQATATNSLQCVTVDLTQAYNLDEIAVWHYWADGRSYYSNTTYVSSDNSTWTTIMSSYEAETSIGKRFSAWDSSASVTPIFRITNMVTNGSFENGSTGWTPSNFTMTANSTYKKYGSYSMPIVTANSTHAQMTQNVSITASNKYYGKVSFLRLGTLDNEGGQYDILGFTAGEMDFATSTNTNIASTGQWYDLSAIVNGIETKTVQLRKFTFSKVAIYTDGFTLIDLTATFGSGKEPSKAWCDANLNYFDGSQNFYLSP